MFGKMQVIKQYSRFSRFLLLRQDYNTIFAHSSYSNYNYNNKVPLFLKRRREATTNYYLNDMLASGTRQFTDKTIHRHGF